MKILFEWANDPIVRKNAFSNEAIQWSDHVNWFLDKLNDPNCLFFIFYLKSTPIGQIRIDFKDNEGIIDYSVASNHRGKGLGTALLKIISSIYPPHLSLPLKGIVKTSNVGSIKAFQFANFTELDKVIIRNSTCSVFKKFIK